MTVSAVNTFLPATAPASGTAANPTAEKVASAATGAIAATRQVPFMAKAWDVCTFPSSSYLGNQIQKVPCLRDCAYPFLKVCYFIMDLFYAAYYKIKDTFTTPQLTFTKEQIADMKTNYWALGKDKLREGMEKGYYDSYGPLVFDRGLHGGAVEPGFKRSYDRAAHFLSYQFGRKMDANFYLDIHSIACGHFMGDANGTLMGQEKVGVFRDVDDGIQWNNALSPSFGYPATPEAIRDLNALNEDVFAKFGTRLAHFVVAADGSQTLSYEKLSREQITKIFNYFCKTLYTTLEAATTDDEKITAICDFNRKCEWLHSTRDGCGRCDILTMNFLLTQQGFHPGLLDKPFIGNVATLESFTQYVKNGMEDWEAARDGKPFAVRPTHSYDVFVAQYKVDHPVVAAATAAAAV